MISSDSPLLNLPINIDRKQALFFDGIRHSAEFVALSYERLRDTLTSLALNSDSSKEATRRLISCAFLDAWAIVDAVDRFRTLWSQIRSDIGTPRNIDQDSSDKLLSSFRDLRNVADHLAQRADYVISRKGTALGAISWLTAMQRQPLVLLICTILPGTVTENAQEVLSPTGRSFPWPTGSISLEAGGYKACLCDAIPIIELHIRFLEAVVMSGTTDKPLSELRAASDVVSRFVYRLEEDQ